MPTLKSKIFFPLLISLLFIGCTHRERDRVVEMVTPPFNPTNYAGVANLPPDITRIAILPAHFPFGHSQMSQDINILLQSELNKINVAEIVPVPELFLVHNFKQLSFDSTGSFPHDFFNKIHDKFTPDAILMVDITQYRPYKPISIGIRCKLVSLHTADIIWSFDMVFDGGDPHVAVAAKSFERSYNRLDYPMSVSSSILQSPSRFVKYVAHAVFSTFPEHGKPLAASLDDIKKPDTES